MSQRRERKMGTIRERHEANKYYALLLLCLFISIHERWPRITLREFIKHNGAKGGGWRTVTENLWGERTIKERDNCEGVQRAGWKEESALFNFRDSRNAFYAARVSERARRVVLQIVASSANRPSKNRFPRSARVRPLWNSFDYYQGLAE